MSIQSPVRAFLSTVLPSSFESSQNSCELCPMIISILQMRKEKFQNMKEYVQGKASKHSVCQWSSCCLSLVCK